MKRNTKIALGVTGALVALCAGVGILGYQGVKYAGETLAQSSTNDPGEVADIASKIAIYELPPGYAGRFGMDIMGTRMAGFGGASAAGTQAMLMLMEYPSGMVNPEQMQEQLANSAGQQDREFTLVETREVIIRGKPSTVIRNQGLNDDGEALYQELAAFETADGMGMFMAIGEVEGWNQAMVDDFMASLR